MTSEAAAKAQADIESGKVISFPKGIPGFEEHTKFRIFHKGENENTIYWMESHETPNITFTLVDPTIYGLHYDLHLSDEEQDVLQTNNPLEIAVFLILTKDESQSPEDIGLKANIGGPILINPTKKLGFQKVIVKSQVNVNIVED